MLVQLRIRTAIDIVSGNDAVSRLENGQHRMDRRQTGGEGKSPSTMFELRDLPFEVFARWISATCVIPTGHGIDRLKCKSGRFIDRRIHGPGVIVVHRFTVDQLCVESCHHAPPRVVELFRAHIFHACTIIYLTRKENAPHAWTYRHNLYDV